MGDSPRYPYFPFYVADWLTSETVVTMTLEQRGAYITLLCHQWIKGSIPDDIGGLAALVGVDSTAMAELWHTLKKCFVPYSKGHGRLVNQRLLSEWQKSRKVSFLKAEAGRKGAKARWSKGVTGHSTSHAVAIPPAIILPMAKNGYSESETESDAELKKEKEGEPLVHGQNALIDAEEFSAITTPMTPAAKIRLAWEMDMHGAAGLPTGLVPDLPRADRHAAGIEALDRLIDWAAGTHFSGNYGELRARLVGLLKKHKAGKVKLYSLKNTLGDRALLMDASGKKKISETDYDEVPEWAE